MATTEAEARKELANKLVLMLGSNGTGVSQTLLDSAIDTALDDVSRLKPKSSYVVMNMVAGQAVYAAPEGTYKVLDVVFPDVSALSAVGLDTAFPYVPTDSPPMSHSVAVIEAQQWEQFQNLHGYDWEYDADAQTVKVMPVPTTSGKMALQVSVLRTVLDLPVSMRRALELLTVAAALDDLAGSVGGGITSVPIGIGSVTFDPKRLTEQADQLREKAYARLGIGRGQVIAG